MPRFFIDSLVGGKFTVTGEQAKHIEKSLRMKIGETLILCHDMMDYECEITGFSPDGVAVRLLKSQKNENEPNVRVTLYQALPKGDKLDTVIMKAVELGVHEICPILSERSVSRPDEKSALNKVRRWRKIAEEAAMQSQRGIIPAVSEILGFDEALKKFCSHELCIVFYEGGGESLREILKTRAADIAVFIGPEGGIGKAEIARFMDGQAVTATLGKRILRTETAPVTALSIIMFETENM